MKKANIDEDINSKNQYRIKILPDPTSIREAASKKYIDRKFIDPSLKKDSAHVNFNDKNLNNVRFVKINSRSTLEQPLIPKLYVDRVISNFVDESSLLRLDPCEKMK